MRLLISCKFKILQNPLRYIENYLRKIASIVQNFDLSFIEMGI